MQQPNRPQVPPKIRIITAWVIWGAFLLTLAFYYYLGWVFKRDLPQENTTAPVSVLVLMAAVTGSISLASNLFRRSRMSALGKKFIALVVSLAFGESVALYGFVIKFVYNTAPDRALLLLTVSAALHLINIPTDFKEIPPPLPGEPVIPPNIG